MSLTFVFILLGCLSGSTSAAPRNLYKQVDYDHHEETTDAFRELEMTMYFYTGTEATILFSIWTTTALPGFLVSCFVIAFVSALYEGLKVLRHIWLRPSSSPSSCRVSKPDQTKLANGETNYETFQIKEEPTTNSYFGTHLLQSLLHLVQLTVGYCLMLIVMTFNLWLGLAVVLGGGIGYLIFAWKLFDTQSSQG